MRNPQIEELKELFNPNLYVLNEEDLKKLSKEEFKKYEKMWIDVSVKCSEKARAPENKGKEEGNVWWWKSQSIQGWIIGQQNIYYSALSGFAVEDALE